MGRIAKFDDRSNGLRSGFTLFELLLTVGLIGLLSTMFVWNINSMLKQSEIETLENTFWDAVEIAKRDSVFNRRPYTLRFNEDDLAFELVSGEEIQAFTVDTNDFGGDTDIEVAFQEELPENGSVLIGGRLVTTREIEYVRFFPDGTCSPFGVSLKIADYVSEISIDPWTGAEMVPMEEAL